ncbi:MAG: hypothetical protein V3R58_08555 [candidate division NC10 bacterium]|jgi:hypothetical protein
MGARDLQESLIKVVERAQGIEIRRYEQREEGPLHDELLPTIKEALSEAIDTFTQVIESYSTPITDDDTGAVSDPPHASFGSDTDSTRHGAERIADMSFVARWELHQEREELGKNSFSKEMWSLVNACSSARRRLTASAIAVEYAICAQEGLTSTLHELYLLELNHSLQIRHAYALFRNTVVGKGPPNPKNVRHRLRKVATAIKKLTRSDIYSELRTSDRVHLQELRGRLAECVGVSRDGDPHGALRLWQDIENLSELLLGINNRSELREHDQSLVTEAYSSLFQSDGVPDSIAEELQVRLQSLFGRDAEVDHLIVIQGPHSPENWKSPLERLLESLSPNRQETDWPEVSLESF